MSRLTLNLGEGTVIFPFSLEAGMALKSAIAELMRAFQGAASAGGERVKAAPKPNLEFQHPGEVFLECFCNPNIWPSPFAAKVLITVRDERIRLTTEAELMQLNEDLQQFLEQA
jgi:hypothetical protein